MNEARMTWQEEGTCRGVDPEVFFPISDDEAWRAKEICTVCPVKADCLVYSLENRERYGVWGGITERERQEMFRRGVAQRVLSDALQRAG
jgi:WhiB family redox-sensing transcriptional regulator